VAGRLVGEAEINRGHEARLHLEGLGEGLLGARPVFSLVVADADPVEDFGIAGELCPLALQGIDLRWRDRRRLAVAGACRKQKETEEARPHDRARLFDVTLKAQI
jgi:hypothetical protein